jgi:hypothetical protein
MFIWRHERFWYSHPRMCWSRKHFDVGRSYQALHAMGVERLEEGLSEVVGLDAAFSRALTYGDNVLDVNAKPFPQLVLAELLKPFFAFQVPLYLTCDMALGFRGVRPRRLGICRDGGEWICVV